MKIIVVWVIMMMTMGGGEFSVSKTLHMSTTPMLVSLRWTKDPLPKFVTVEDGVYLDPLHYKTQDNRIIFLWGPLAAFIAIVCLVICRLLQSPFFAFEKGVWKAMLGFLSYFVLIVLAFLLIVLSFIFCFMYGFGFISGIMAFVGLALLIIGIISFFRMDENLIIPNQLFLCCVGSVVLSTALMYLQV